VIAAIHHAKHVPEVLEVRGVKARWTGHRLQAELAIAVYPELSVVEAQAIATAVREIAPPVLSSRGNGLYRAFPRFNP